MRVIFDDAVEMRFWFSYTGRETVIHCLYQDVEYLTCARAVKSDQMVKAKGRRIALTRMLKQGLMKLASCSNGTGYWHVAKSFSRDERGWVWKQYFLNHSDLKKRGQQR